MTGNIDSGLMILDLIMSNGSFNIARFLKNPQSEIQNPHLNYLLQNKFEMMVGHCIKIIKYETFWI